MSTIQQMLVSYGSRPAELSAVGTSVITSTASSFSFNMPTVGAPKSSKSYIIVAVSARTSASITSAKFEGGNMTLARQVGSGNTRTNIYYIETLATTGTIAIVFSANSAGCLVSVYRFEPVPGESLRIRTSEGISGVSTITLAGLVGDEQIVVATCAWNSTSATLTGYSAYYGTTVGSAWHVGGIGFAASILTNFSPAPSSSSAVVVAFY